MQLLRPDCRPHGLRNKDLRGPFRLLQIVLAKQKKQTPKWSSIEDSEGKIGLLERYSFKALTGLLK